MKLSTKGRYGIRFMVDLATRKDGVPVPLGDIAERQGLSEKYLWQVIFPLKAAGLIDSTRGARGGYRLARDAAHITIADILTPLEGKLTLVECVDHPDACPRNDTCIASRLWTDLSQRMFHVLDSVNLKELIRNYSVETLPTPDHDIQAKLETT